MWWYSLMITLIVALMARFVPGLWEPRPEGTHRQRVLTHRATVMPDMLAQDIFVMEQAEATTTWQMRADGAELYDANHVAFLSNVQGQLWRHVTEPLHLTAVYGRVDSKTGDMMVKGHVQLDSLAGYTIETDILYWQAANQILYTDAAVNIHNAAVQLAGIGLHSNIDEASFVLQNNVRASFQLP